MSKIKIHEIAKKIGVVSKEVVTRAKEIGINVSSHLSSVEENEANRIIEAFENKTEKIKVEEEKIEKTRMQEMGKEKLVKESKKNDTTVIIRREVIINDNDEKDINKKKQEERNKNVGFVERNKKDYNIVYRNRPSKPLTVNELFGIKDNKKEDNKKEDNKKEENKKEIRKSHRTEDNSK